MVLRALLFWVLLMILAMLNGTVRVFGITPYAGERVGHWISTVMLCVLILAATWYGSTWLAPKGTMDAWRVGGLWLILTLAFEFLAGHYVFEKPWEQLLADYNLMNGRIWVLVLITTLLAPRLVSIWR